jgi:endoglycosylceramidase
MVSWLEWAYCGCSDPTTAGPGSQQAIVLDPAKPPAGSNLVIGTLRSLVEAYPQVVAGTPVGWSFDATSRTLRFTYSTARASATAPFPPARAPFPPARAPFPRGAETEISAPGLVYAGGYAARAAGGAIVSEPGASVLRVLGCPRANRVDVTVTPSGPGGGSCR